MNEVRVRFAPSPTGPLHIGGVRTALYNYLFAKKNNGKFILRIEDTDQTRFVPGAEDYIVESLKWCGIDFDEGVHIGGQYAPYRQSDRKEIYHQYALSLLEKGYAYYAFDSAEDLENLRKESEKRKETFQYGPKSRMALKNSLTIDKEEVTRLLETGHPFVIRIKIPEHETVLVNDLIRGEVKVESGLLDDKVLYKSDGMPTYHLANVVDDYLMKITHVIRGEEWLPSAPLHALLYRYLGWESVMPAFAHLPLLLKPDGNGKLSKRDGDRLGFPVFPLRWTDPKTGDVSSGYRESGYLPEAFINMLALLGWNPGTEQEILSMAELIELFSIDRVGKSGSKFDPEKARWINHQYLASSPDETIADLLEKIITGEGIQAERSKLLQISGLIKDRANLIPDLWQQSWFFFRSPEKYDESVIHKFWKPETPGFMMNIAAMLEGLSVFDAATVEASLKQFIHEQGLPMGQVMNTLRLVLVGGSFGPGVAAIIAVLGKEEAISRINHALDKIGK